MNEELTKLNKKFDLLSKEHRADCLTLTSLILVVATSQYVLDLTKGKDDIKIVIVGLATFAAFISTAIYSYKGSKLNKERKALDEVKP